MGCGRQSEIIHVMVVELGPVSPKRNWLGEGNSEAHWTGNSLCELADRNT